MADGSVVIKIDADDRELRKAEGSVKKFTASLLLAKVAGKAFDAITNSLDQAIQRFDTLNQFPRVLEGIGFGAEDSERAIAKLSDGIQGLPTALDSVADTAKQLALITNDIDKAVDITLALNNAFLASGASTEEAAQGLEQYSKMLATGEVNLMSWRTLMQTMGPALDDVAESMGFAGKTAQMDLYKALKDGDVTMDEFNNAMITADQAVGGFADRALEGSAGIATSMANIKTAVVSGVEKIIRVVDTLMKEVFGLDIAGSLNVIKDATATAFSAIASVISGLTPILKATLTVAKALKPVILGVASAYASLMVIEKLNSVFDKSNQAIRLSGALSEGLSMSIKTQTVATEAETIATALSTKAITAKEFIMGLLSGKITLATGATALYTIATTALKTAIDFLLGPVGLAIIAIGALVAAGVAMYDWLMDTTPEVDEMTDSMEQQSEASEDLNQSIEGSSEAYDRNMDAISGQSEVMEQLIAETMELTEQENLNNAEKKMLEENIELINGSMEGLNMAYDEESGLLSHSNELMDERLDAFEAEEAMHESQERLTEIRREQVEVEAQLEENTNLMNEAQKMREELTWKDIGAKKELDEQIDSLKANNGELELTQDTLSESEEIATIKTEENAQIVADAEEASKNRRVEYYHELSEEQKEAYDEMQTRMDQLVEEQINGWEAIEVGVDLTMDQMKENLEANTKTTEAWSEDLNTLAERGVSEGMLANLERMGPEGADLVAEFVNSSDQELADFEEVYGDAGISAKDRMLEEIDMSEEDLTPGMYEMFGTAEAGWEEAVDTSSISKSIPEKISKGIEESKGDMKDSGKSVVDGVVEGIDENADLAGTASENVGKEVDKSFGSILGIASPSTVFRQHGSDLITGLHQGITQGSPKVINAMTKLGSNMNKAMDQAMDKLNTSNTQSLNKYTQSIQRMAKQMQAEMTRITRMLSKTSDDMSNTMKQLEQRSNVSWRAIAQTINQNTMSMDRDLKQTSRSMQSDWTSMINRLNSITRSGFSRMVSTMRTQLRSAENSARASSRNVASNLRSGISSAVSSGRAMGNGFNRGLSSTQGGIMNTARRIAYSASSAIKSALKIHSPSRVTYGFGENFGEGFVGGIDSMLSGVSKSGQNLAESAIPNVNPLSGFGKLGKGQAGMGQITNNNDNGVNLVIENIENNSDSDIPRILEESAWIMEGKRRGQLDG